MFLFYVLSFFKKGDTIQRGNNFVFFKGGHYLRKYGMYSLFNSKFICLPRFYLDKFKEDYPKDRKAVIPFII